MLLQKKVWDGPSCKTSVSTEGLFSHPQCFRCRGVGAGFRPDPSVCNLVERGVRKLGKGSRVFPGKVSGHIESHQHSHHSTFHILSAFPSLRHAISLFASCLRARSGAGIKFYLPLNSSVPQAFAIPLYEYCRIARTQAHPQRLPTYQHHGLVIPTLSTAGFGGQRRSFTARSCAGSFVRQGQVCRRLSRLQDLLHVQPVRPRIPSSIYLYHSNLHQWSVQ